MKILYNVLGYRDFNKKSEILEKIRRSKYFKEREILAEENYLILFKSSEQILWLFASSKSIYIVLDDVVYEKVFLELYMTIDGFYQSDKYVERETGSYGRGMNKFIVYTDAGVKGFLYSTDTYPMPEKLWDSIDRKACRTFTLTKKTHVKEFTEKELIGNKGVFIHKAAILRPSPTLPSLSTEFYDSNRETKMIETITLIKRLDVFEQREFLIERYFINEKSLPCFEIKMLIENIPDDFQYEIFYQIL